MELTIPIIITTITLVAGEIIKMTPIPNEFIPLQNLIIAIIASVVCIIFKVENMEPLEIIVMCIWSTMSAGGIADMKKIKTEKIGKHSKK